MRRQEKQRSREAAENSLEAVAEEWLGKQAHRWDERHTSRVRASLRKNLYDDIGHRPLAEIEAPIGHILIAINEQPTPFIRRFWHRHQELVEVYQRVHDDRWRSDSMIHPDQIVAWAMQQGIPIPDTLATRSSKFVSDDDTVRSTNGEGEQRPGVPKSDVLVAPWPAKANLGRKLSDVPKWLEPALVARGRPGSGVPSTWNPARIAECLHRKNLAGKATLTKVLTAHFPDWTEEWDDISQYLD